MGATSVRHRTLNVSVSPDAYVFEPVEPQDGKDVMVLDRLTGTISLNPPNRAIPLTHEAVHTVYGILGIISLSLTDYVILITGLHANSPRFQGHDVHSPSCFLLLPLSSSAAATPSPQEAHLLGLVQHALDTTRLWFSYTLDLTSSMQRQNDGQTGDERFFWNWDMTRRIVDAGQSGRKDSVVEGGAESGGSMSSFVLPVICGSFDLRSVSLPGSPPFLLLLISRRSRHRPGTRYFRRGIDALGNVANYVETEQIVVCDRPTPTEADEKSGALGGGVAAVGEGSVKASFVQVRGSAPVFWAQICNLRYVPDLLVMDLPSTTDALKTHLQAQVDTYKKVHLVNLVNQVKYERPVKEAFENALLVLAEAEDKVKYWYWDFHRECKGMRFERVEALVGKLQKELDDEGWFQWEGPLADIGTGRRRPRKEQTSVVRTNCMDSLDRTNVVQSALARHILDQQLRSFGLLGANDSVIHHPEFMHQLRNAWADHADYVSTMYSGTGALKTDFTRTGKRSWRGALEDGRRSVIRYYKNNFRDGERQDALDLITGSWKIRRGTPSPFSDNRSLVTQVMPFIFVFSFLLFLSGSYASAKGVIDLGPRAYLHLPALLIIATMSFVHIWLNGIQYVDWPHLSPISDLLSYTGPGFRSTPNGRGFSLFPRFARSTKTSSTAFSSFASPFSNGSPLSLSTTAFSGGTGARRPKWTDKKSGDIELSEAARNKTEGVSHAVEGGLADQRRKGRPGRLD